MKRLVIWPSFLLLPLLMVVLIAAGVLLFTPTGIGVALAIADRILGSALEVRGWRGTLVSTICADSIVYQQDGLGVEADDACIDPKLWASFDFLKLSIASVDAAAVRIYTVSMESEVPAPSDRRELSTPLRIEVDRAAIGVLDIDGFRLDDLRTRIHLDDDDIDSNSTFTQAGRPVAISTSGPWQRLTLEGSIGVPEAIYVAGSVDLTRYTLPYKATLQTESLPLSQFTDRDLTLSGVRLGLEGDLTRYDYVIDARVDDGALGGADVQAEGSGSLEGLTLDALITARPLSDAIGALDGLSLRGELSWSPAFSFDLVAVADAVPLSFGDYRALLSGTVHGQGTPTSIELNVDGLTGTVNDEAVAGDGKVRWSAPSTSAGFDLWIEDTSLAVGAGTMDLNGVIGSSGVDMKGIARDLSLSFFHSPLGGWLSGSVKLSGSYDAPAIEAAVAIRELSYAGVSVGAADLDLRGTPARGGLEFDLKNLDVHPGGTDTGGQSGPLVAGVMTRGRIDYRQVEQRWTIDIGALSASFEDARSGPVQFDLAEPATINYQAGELNLEDFCLRADVALVSGNTAEICGSLRYPQGPLRLRVAEIQLLDFHTPINEVSLNAIVGMRMDFDILQPLTGSGEVTIRDLVALPDEDTQIVLGSLTAKLDIDRQAAVLTLLTPGDQPLVLDGRLDVLRAESLPASSLDGRISVDVDGIWAIETFLPMDINYELADMRGALELDATVGGTVAEPEIRGGIRITEAGWDVLAVGAAFTGVEIDARLEDAQHIGFTAHGLLGNGAFTLAGDLRDLTSDTRHLNVALELEPGRVVDLPDYRADIGGRLEVEMGRKSLQIGGELTMPEALIRIQDLPDTAVSVSADVIVVDENMKESATVQQLRTSDVLLKLGKDVRLQAFGLDTELRGSVRVIERPNLPPDVRGTITLRNGMFEAYGQELEVERGTLNFVGPMDDPNIDVIASRKVPYGDTEVTVSLLLGGSAKAITTEVSSVPTLPEGDALALLMTGRTLSEMSSQEQSNVYGAAIALGLYGASAITEGVASTLGLEEIILEQDTFGEVKVGAAVRLNKDLYLRYTYGVFSRLGGVLLRYRLSNRLSVQGQAGDAQSIEIRYGVDG